MTPFVEHAVKLGERGLRVFPCWPRTKKPVFEDNLRLASIVEGIIRKFWSDPNFNIAIATGRGSGIWVLDVDGLEGEATLRELVAKHGDGVELPPTVEVITGDGGRHLYFKWPAKVEIRNNPSSPDHEAALPCLHWRGEGGYAIAPPSIHPDTSCAYTWSIDSARKPADAPDWLLSIVTERRGKALAKATPAPTLPSDWEALVSRQHSGSLRACALAKFSGLLLRKYLDPAVVIALAGWFDNHLCEPPLGQAEVLRIYLDIAEREAGRRENANERR